MPLAVTVDEETTDQALTSDLIAKIETHLEPIFHALDLNDPVVSLLLTNDPHIQSLNAQWRQKDEPTDVLSFPAFEAASIPDDPPHLGDIIISVETAQRMVTSGEHRSRVAEELQRDPRHLDWTLSDEVAFLFIHGLLHLLGFDHLEADEEDEMKRHEAMLWSLMSDDLSPPSDN